MSGIRRRDCSKLAKNRKNDNDVTHFRWRQRHIFWAFFFLFLLSILGTGPSFMSISSLVLELWQFSFIRGWPEIRVSEIPPYELRPISGAWTGLWIPNLSQMSLIECYWMPQNIRVTAFTFFELLRENQLGREGELYRPPRPRASSNPTPIFRVYY